MVLPALATKTGEFMSELVQSETGHYQRFDVALEPPVALQAGASSILWKLSSVGHRPGMDTVARVM